MFCPGRNMRNLDKNESRRTDQSGRSAGAPLLTGLAARRRIIAGVAAVIAVAIIVAAGLNTSWFGLAGPHLVPGNYTLSGSSASNTIVASVTQGNHVDPKSTRLNSSHSL